MKQKIQAGLAALALIAGSLFAAAPAQAGAAPILSAATAKQGQSIKDPSGQVHVVGKTTGQGNMSAKGNARPGVKSEKPSKLLALTYFYNVGYQYPGGVGSEGVRSDLDITSPTLDTANGDFHTLNQIWAQSADGSQAVEVGTVKSQNVNGDLNPHLFVYARKNGVSPTGWNGSFTALAGAAYTAGQSLAGDVGTGIKRFAAQYFDGVWWANYNNVWFGYFNPNTAGLWNTAPTVSFTKAGLGQTGGEVAANSSAPCTDMGNGNKGKVSGAINTSAAHSWNWSLLTPPTGVASSLSLDPPTNSTYYDHILNTGSVRSFYFGGPGAC